VNGFLSNYLLLHPGQFPNSTDIHSVYKKKDISWYLSKEISKNMQDKKTTGKIWDCSLNIKGKKFFSIIEPSNLTALIDSSKIKFNDQCGIYNKGDPHKIMPRNVRDKYHEWRQSIIKEGLY
jgi:hypothetical protein